MADTFSLIGVGKNPTTLVRCHSLTQVSTWINQLDFSTGQVLKSTFATGNTEETLGLSTGVDGDTFNMSVSQSVRRSDFMLQEICTL